jgi:nicotine oxidoreductase
MRQGEGQQRVNSSDRRLTWMGQTISERLAYLRKANSNRPWINDDLYRLLYKVDLYVLAYERIKSKPGNMTPGTDGETLNGFSMQTIQTIIQEM